MNNNSLISYQKPTVQDFLVPGNAAGITCKIWREDQNHPQVSGNKWWKLKYNIQQALTDGHHTVLTFGGAYSNHIYATAAACAAVGLKSIGVIRGEEVQPLNSTLAFARSCGMQFHFITREEYRKKTEPEFLLHVEKQWGRSFMVPEGGTNAWAVKGCEELGKNLLTEDFDYCCLPVGTGGTMAGIINAFAGERKIIGVPVLKNGAFLEQEIKRYLKSNYTNWQLKTEYHFGGYAKSTDALEKFIQSVSEQHIPLEFVYSGKLFWAVADLVQRGFFESGSKVLVLHTGGIRP